MEGAGPIITRQVKHMLCAFFVRIKFCKIRMSYFLGHLVFGYIQYTECPRRNVKYFGRVFLMLNYTDITQNTYIQS